MAFACTRPKTKDDLHANAALEKRIAESSDNNVDLSNMNLTDRDVPIIVKKAIRKKKTSCLSVATNKFSADGLRSLVDALKANKNLTHLIVSSNPVGDEGIPSIVDLIRSHRTLYNLSLCDTGITDRGVEMLAKLLQSGTAPLRCLDLRSNKLITDSSVDFLLQMAQTNQTLSACRLDNCGLSSDGRDKLREADSVRW